MRYDVICHDLLNAITSSHGVTCNYTIGFCLKESRIFHQGGAWYSDHDCSAIVQGKTSETVIMLG